MVYTWGQNFFRNARNVSATEHAALRFLSRSSDKEHRDSIAITLLPLWNQTVAPSLMLNEFRGLFSPGDKTAGA
jgi:hypothetical protein